VVQAYVERLDMKQVKHVIAVQVCAELLDTKKIRVVIHKLVLHHNESQFDDEEQMMILHGKT